MAERPNASHLIRERREHLQCNGTPDATDDDATEALMADCGLQADGLCLHAGSEQCDWECPFN